jgi:hypothetical protein
MRTTARIATVTVLTVAALGVCACGGQDEPNPHAAASRSATATTAAQPSVTAQDVAARFEAVTGDTLSVDHNAPLWDRLSLSNRASDEDSLALTDRYGIFSIYVLQKSSPEAFTTDHGTPIEPDAKGVYWRQTSYGWSGSKVYGGVVLDWSADTRGENEQFQRLDAVLSTLGRPAQAGRAALPASDRPCASAGLTLAGSREGTCRDGNATLTIVNRDGRLRAPGYTLQVTGTERGNVIDSSYSYGDPTYAKGEFIGVVLRVDNTANSAMDGVYDAKLRIGDKVYDQDDRVAYRVADPDAFPLQPGDSTRTEIVFDVPREVAGQALREGALVVPAQEDADVDSASKLAAIRLRKPGKPQPIPSIT